jgi:hypothetical protein
MVEELKVKGFSHRGHREHREKPRQHFQSSGIPALLAIIEPAMENPKENSVLSVSSVARF